MNLGPEVTTAGIEEASRAVDPVFRDSPQFVCEPISARLDVITVLKVETINPIRSFKGRGADYLLTRLGEAAGSLVCASAGNFGQGMAYAARRRGLRLTVFAATNANPLKVERMRALGAEVVQEGDDFDAAKAAARDHSEATGGTFIEDGLLGPIAEGAGTIAVELIRLPDPIDAVFVPLGNGSLINGIGTWLRHASPRTRVVAVVAAGAPAMEISWREGRPVATESIDTIADGIAVRVPVAEALGIMRSTVDEVVTVTDDEILASMGMLFGDAGLVVEPAGAAGLAGIAQRRSEWTGKRVATPLCGSNLTAEQVAAWLRPEPKKEKTAGR